ncbi:hypothetical protein CP02DC22_1121B, partial [Chlamydia psittaci 02DC22]
FDLVKTALSLSKPF